MTSSEQKSYDLCRLHAAVGDTSGEEVGAWQVLSVFGDDSERFLQSQMTADVAALDACRWGLSALCDAKGRVQAVLHLCRVDRGFILLVPAEIAQDVEQRLRCFILRAKVVVAEVKARQWGIMGYGAAARLETAGFRVPSTDDRGFSAEDRAWVMRYPGSLPRFRVIYAQAGASGGADALGGELANASRSLDAFDSAHPAGERWWWLAQDICAGMPIVRPATRELWIPQALNLDLLSGVSFTKGCYMGQEVVARVQHLAEAKRRMLRARVGASDAPPANTPVFGRDGSTWRKIGAVVDAVAGPDGCELLVTAPFPLEHEVSLRLGDPTGLPMDRVELPYSLEARVDG